ncbi:MAG: hypothetical protein ABFR62_03000 [Bacteroidota bacterium]
MKKIIIVLFITIIGSIIYSKFSKLDTIVVSVENTSEIPSGSGIVFHNDEYFIIGDDSPWLYKYEDETIEKKTLISYKHKTSQGRVDKKKKADFEDIDIVNYNKKEYLFVVSSGSKKLYRDTVFVLNAVNPEIILFKKNIRPLYDKMKKKAGLKKVNIEGFTSDENQVYFAHRGNHDRNVIFKIDKKKFFDFIQDKNKKTPDFRVLSIQLPTDEGMQAGFSSLQFVKEINSLLFTASLEGSKDAYNDGEIKGSYIGILPINEPHKITTTPLMKDRKFVITKLEGITVYEFDASNNEIKAIAVSDNDDGKTEIFNIKIRY